MTALVPGQWLTEGRPERVRRRDRPADAHAPGVSIAAARRASRRWSATSRALPAAPRRRRGSPAICTCCRTSSAIARRSPIRAPRGAMVGLDLDEDEASLQALYVAGLCGLAQGLGAGDARARSGRLSRSTRWSPAAARRAARWCARSSPTSAAGASSPPRPRSRCCWARRCSARSPPGATTWPARCARCRGLSEVTEPAGGEIAALHARSASRSRRCNAPSARSRGRARASRSAWPKLVHLRLRRRAGRQRADLAGAAPATVLAALGFEIDDAESARSVPRHQRRRRRAECAEARLGARLPRDFEADLARDVIAQFERELKGVPFVREAVARARARRSASPRRVRPSASALACASSATRDLFGPRIYFRARGRQWQAGAGSVVCSPRASMGVAPARLSGHRGQRAPA